MAYYWIFWTIAAFMAVSLLHNLTAALLASASALRAETVQRQVEFAYQVADNVKRDAIMNEQNRLVAESSALQHARVANDEAYRAEQREHWKVCERRYLARLKESSEPEPHGVN